MKELVFYISELQKENASLRNDITAVKQSFSEELEDLKQKYRLSSFELVDATPQQSSASKWREKWFEWLPFINKSYVMLKTKFVSVRGIFGNE